MPSGIPKLKRRKFRNHTWRVHNPTLAKQLAKLITQLQHLAKELS
jgi:hypothetical protein